MWKLYKVCCKPTSSYMKNRKETFIGLQWDINILVKINGFLLTLVDTLWTHKIDHEHLNGHSHLQLMAVQAAKRKPPPHSILQCKPTVQKSRILTNLNRVVSCQCQTTRKLGATTALTFLLNGDIFIKRTLNIPHTTSEPATDMSQAHTNAQLVCNYFTCAQMQMLQVLSKPSAHGTTQNECSLSAHNRHQADFCFAREVQTNTLSIVRHNNAHNFHIVGTENTRAQQIGHTRNAQSTPKVDTTKKCK